MTTTDRELVSIPGIVPENYDSISPAAGSQTAARLHGRKAVISLQELQADRGRTYGQMRMHRQRRDEM